MKSAPAAAEGDAAKPKRTKEELDARKRQTAAKSAAAKAGGAEAEAVAAPAVDDAEAAAKRARLEEMKRKAAEKYCPAQAERRVSRDPESIAGEVVVDRACCVLRVPCRFRHAAQIT